jgi:hypothetical protein
VEVAVLRAKTLCISACVLSGYAAAAATATEDTSSRLESPRALAGHVFQLSGLAPGPFVTTSFGTATIAGFGDVRSVAFDINGREIGVRTYPVAAFGQGFDFAAAITSDLGLRMSAQGAAFSGTTAIGAVVVGTSAQYDVHAGLVAGHTFGAVRGAIVFDIGARPDYSILVANAVLGAIQTQRFDNLQALQTTSRYYFSPGGSLAVALHPSFGLVGEGRFLWSRLATGEDDRAVRRGVIVGGSADFDLDPLIGFPLGIQAVSQLETAVSNSGIRRAFQIGGGLYYTRRVRLQLGLEVVSRTGQLRETTPTFDLSSALATIRLRYYW